MVALVVNKANVVFKESELQRFGEVARYSWCPRSEISWYPIKSSLICVNMSCRSGEQIGNLH
jgi:hypothetical protein